MLLFEPIMTDNNIVFLFIFYSWMVCNDSIPCSSFRLRLAGALATGGYWVR